jgi:hypothetical protein
MGKKLPKIVITTITPDENKENKATSSDMVVAPAERLGR